jgi:hypothetical protein
LAFAVAAGSGLVADFRAARRGVWDVFFGAFFAGAAIRFS